MITALIDADLLVYKVAFVCQHTEYSLYIKGEEEAGRLASFFNKTDLNTYLKEVGLDKQEVTIESETTVDSNTKVHALADLMIDNILHETGAGAVEVYLSGKDNFRDKLFPIYKAGRGPKPLLYTTVRQYYTYNKWDAHLTIGYEADDALGIRQTKDSIICSTDKDLDTIPGWHYNFDTEKKYFVSEEKAYFNLDIQRLTGDSVDNILGIPKIGPKTATKLLRGLDSDERQAVLEKYYKKQWGEDWAEMLDLNTKLLTILQEEPCA